MIRKRTDPNCKIYCFTVSSKEPYNTIFRQISKHNGFIYIENISNEIEKQEAKGLCVRVNDGSHWNEKGHKIAGELLSSYFQKQQQK
jgi:hypothetical protein